MASIQIMKHMKIENIKCNVGSMEYITNIVKNKLFLYSGYNYFHFYGDTNKPKTFLIFM